MGCIGGRWMTGLDDHDFSNHNDSMILLLGSETGRLHVFSLKILIMPFNATCSELVQQMG